MIPCCSTIIPLKQCHHFSFNHLRLFDFLHTHTHPFSFPPTSRAAIALQTHLAYPPPIPWPCATTTTLPPSTLSRFFMVSPVKTGTLPIFFFLSFFNPFCALGLHPPHPHHHTPHPRLRLHLRSLL